MAQSVYQVPPGGVATVNAARLLMSPGLGCGNCRPGPHCSRCPRRAMRYYYPSTIRGLGDLTVDPTLLFIGIGVLFVGAFMFGGRATPALRKRKVSRLKAKRDRYSKRIAELEV